MKKSKPIEPRTFAGKPLQPFTYQRQEVACAMGFRRGFVARYRTQDLLPDTRIALWLCSIPAERIYKQEGKPEEWSVDRAEEETAEAIAESRAWAQRVGIGINTKAFHEGWKLLLAMMDEIQEAKGEPIIPEGEAREETDLEL